MKRSLFKFSFFIFGLVTASACPIFLSAQPGPGAHSPTSEQFNPEYRPEFFDQQREFPNLFLPEEYRGKSRDEIPKKVLETARENLSKALQSVFERLVVPVVPEGSEILVQVRYFPYLREKLGAGVKIMPSGGVVRSAIGYLYQELYDGMLKIPPTSPEETLAKIISDKGDIAGYKLRGLGSDFDILMETSTGNFSEAKRQVLKVTHSAESAFGARNIEGDFKRSLFTVGDVKEYSEQTSRSTSQGGSAIDFLAFDLEKGSFREPPAQLDIVNDLICGLFQYLPPESEGKVEDWTKQTVRGIRPLIELPFLRVKDERQFRIELERLKIALQKGENISDKAFDQFQKMIRNIRNGGGHNRIYRGKPGSLEALILEVNDLVQAKGKRGIPEYADSFRLEVRDPVAKTELRGIPKELLTPIDKFIETRTTNGTVYHGTPSVDNALAIFRQGYFLSGGHNDQGGSAEGTAIYTGVSPNSAKNFPDGVTIEEKIRRDPRINILDLSKVGDHSAIVAIREKALKDGKNFHQALIREHGIDILLGGANLILNAEIFEKTHDLGMVLKAFTSQFVDPEASLETRLKSYEVFIKLYPYAQALGLEDIPKVVSPLEFVRMLGPRMKEIEAKTANLEARRENLATRLIQSQPSLFYTAQRTDMWHGRTPELFHLVNFGDERRIDDRTLRAEFIDICSLVEERRTLKNVLDMVRNTDLLGFIQQYPNEISAQDFHINLTYLGGRRWEVEEDLSNNERLTWSIIQKVVSGEGLTEPEWKIVASMIRLQIPTEAFGIIFSSSNKQLRERILSEIKNLPNGGAELVLRILRPSSALWSTRDGKQEAERNSIQDSARGWLRSAMHKDQVWRSQIRDYIRNLTGSHQELGSAYESYPWDLKDAKAVSLLQEAYGNQEVKEQALDDVLIELRKMGLGKGTDSLKTLKTNLDSINESMIKDEALRLRFLKAKNDYLLSTHVAPYHIERLRNKNPQEIDKLFDPSRIETNPRESEPYINSSHVEEINKAEQNRKLAEDVTKTSAKIRELLQQPLRQQAASALGTLLGAEGRTRTLALNRIKQWSEKDDPLVLTALLRDSYRPKEVRDVVLEVLQRPNVRQKARDLAQIAFEAGEEISFTYIIENFPWDLEKDVELLKKWDKQVKEEQAEERKERLKDRLWMEQRSLFTQQRENLWQGHIQGVLEINPENIDSRELRQEHNDIDKANRRRQMLRQAIHAIWNNDPLNIIETFPEYVDANDLRFYGKYLGNFQWQLGSPTSKGKQLFMELVEKVRSRKELTEQDWKIVRILIQEGGVQDQLGILFAVADSKQLAKFLDKIAKPHSYSTKLILEILHPEHHLWAVNSGAQENERNQVEGRVRAAVLGKINKDANLKNLLRKYIIDIQGTRWDFIGAYRSYPWDLNDPEDVRILKATQEDAEKHEKELESVLIELRKLGLDKEGHALKDLKDNADFINLEMISDPVLRSRVELARRNYLMSHIVGPMVLRQLAEQNPVRTKEVFGFTNPDSESAQLRIDSDAVRQLNDGKLESEHSESIRKLLNSPINKNSIDAYNDLYKRTGRSRELVVRRLQRWSNTDDPLALLVLLQSAEENSAQILELINRKDLRDRIKGRLREAFNEGNRNDYRNIFSAFPWDLEKDRAFLSDLIETVNSYEIEKRESILREKLWIEQPSLFLKRPHDPWFLLSPDLLEVTGWDGEHILNPKTREELREIRKLRIRSGMVSEGLEAIVRRDPQSLIDHFPNKADVRELRFNGNYLGNGHWNLKENASQATKLWANIQHKVSEHKVLTNADWRVIDVVISKPDVQTLRPLFAFANDETRKVLFEKLKRSTDGGAPFVLLILRPDSTIWNISKDEQKAERSEPEEKLRTLLKDELAKDLNWRDKVRDHIATRRGPTWYITPGFVSFPWDLNNEADVRLLSSVYKDSERKEVELEEVIKELQKIGLGDKSTTLSDIKHKIDGLNVEIIRDEALRARFLRTRQAYMLSHDVAPQIEATHKISKAGVEKATVKLKSPDSEPLHALVEACKRGDLTPHPKP